MTYTNWTKINGNWVPRRILYGRPEPDNERIMEKCSHWKAEWKRTKPDPDDGRNFMPGKS